MVSDPLIGRELAGYRIEEFIGRGGMGVVYRAEHMMLGRKDAVKLLAAELSADAAFRERFLRESRIAAGMDHPNVIQIHHAGEADGQLYLAMRYVEGSDLRSLLDQRGQLDLDETLAIAEQVGGALDAAHSLGLVHRDVKPANILISQRGQVYLTDFGIAKHTRTRGGLTKPGSFLGTLDYAAPEQIEGKQIDGRADQYALGCVLYHCLAGRAPYEKDTDVQLIYAHLLERAPPPSSCRSGLSSEVDAVLERALSKNPDGRYSSCAELAAALQAALGTAADAAPARRAPAAPTRAARRPLPESMPGPVPVQVPAPAPAPVPEGMPPPQPPAGVRAQPFWRRPLVLGGAGVVVGVAAALAFVVLGGGSGAAKKAENRLLGLVPSGIRGSCTGIDVPVGADAAVSCSPSGESVSYYGFASGGALNSFYSGMLPSGAVRSRGSCADLPRVGERPFTSGGKAAGRVFCGLATDGATAQIGWKDDSALVAARATRGDGNQSGLYRWWSRSAGPLAKAGASKPPRRSVPVPRGAILFSAKLAAPTSGWSGAEVKNVMKARYTAGSFEVLLLRPNRAALPSTALLKPPLSFGDVQLQVDAKPVAGAGGYSFGVTCRSTSRARYRLEIRNDGVFLIARSAGSGTRVLNHKAFGKAIVGGTNRIRASCTGGHGGPVRLALTLKGKTLTATDKNPLGASGAVGVVASSRSKAGVKIRFQNLVIRNSAG